MRQNCKFGVISPISLRHIVLVVFLGMQAQTDNNGGRGIETKNEILK